MKFSRWEVNHSDLQQLVHPDFRLNGTKFHSKSRSLKELISFFKHHLGFQSTAVEEFLGQWINSDQLFFETSGTTSDRPKHFFVKKQVAINSIKITAKYFDLKPNDSALHCSPMNYVVGKMQLLRALVLGLSVDFVKPSAKPLKETLAYDFVAMTPMQVANSLDFLDQVKILLVGGGLFSTHLQKKIFKKNINAFESYGMAETLSHIAIRKITDPIAVFKLLPGVTYQVDNRSCLLVNAPHLDVEKLKTNDRVVAVNHKTFKLLGRVDSLINTGGVKINPEFIEDRLAEVISTSFFVAGIPNEVLGQEIVLVLENTDSKQINSIVEAIQTIDMLKPYEKPKRIFLYEVFIKTSSQKIRRFETLKKIPNKVLDL